MKDWKKEYKSSFSGFSLSDLTWKSWKSWKRTSFYRKGEEEKKLPEEIKNAYQQASDLITVMDLPFPVELKLNSDPAVKKGARALILPTKVFDEDDLTESDKVIISTGQAVHEAEHLKETEMQVLDSARSLFEKAISFLLEDERIEEKLLSERPGFSNHIQKVRKYDTEKLNKNKEWKNILESPHGSLLRGLFSMIRFPELMDEALYEKYKDIYEKVREIISEESIKTRDSVDKAIKIKDILKEYIPEDELDRIETAVCSAFRIMETQGGKDEVNTKRCSPGRLSSKKVNGSTYVDCKVTQGDSEYGTNTNVTFTRMIDCAGPYQKAKKEISPYISAVRKLLTNADKNYDFVVRGMRSGFLDVNKIAEAYQGIPQVYIRKGTVSTNKTRIAVLIDESGSMIDKCDIARKAAILLKEAFEGIPGLELYMYGHTADTIAWDSDDMRLIGTTEITVYKEGSYSPKYSLGNIQGRCQNRDHIAIDEVCTRIRKITDDHIIMFVLSDGVPAAYDWGGVPAMKEVRKVVKKREREGFDIIQINIGRELEEEDMKKMFDNYIFLKDNISEFPKLLSGIIKKAVKADKGTKVSVL